MSSKTSSIVFLVTTLAILLQGLIWYVWNTGALDNLLVAYRALGKEIPETLLFGVRNLSHWWSIPFTNALLLSVVCFVANRSRWLLFPLVLSISSTGVMLYIQYGSLLKMG